MTDLTRIEAAEEEVARLTLAATDAEYVMDLAAAEARKAHAAWVTVYEKWARLVDSLSDAQFRVDLLRRGDQ